MIIELPRKFFMEGQNNSKGAFIEDGVLKISFYDQDSADRAVEMLERHKYDIVKRQ